VVDGLNLKGRCGVRLGRRGGGQKIPEFRQKRRKGRRTTMADNDEMMMPMAMADHDDEIIFDENEEDPLDVSIIVDDSALAQVTHTPDGKYISS
jgi:hypothetical protein